MPVTRQIENAHLLCGSRQKQRSSNSQPAGRPAILQPPPRTAGRQSWKIQQSNALSWLLELVMGIISIDEFDRDHPVSIHHRAASVDPAVFLGYGHPRGYLSQKHTYSRRLFNAGPTSQTLAPRWADAGHVPRKDQEGKQSAPCQIACLPVMWV